MVTLYNRQGRAIAYIDNDGKSIYLFRGAPVAWISENSVYAYSGHYLGWIQNGWFFDRTGQPALFRDEARGGPSKPTRQARPARGARGMRPVRGAREARLSRFTISTSWSTFSDDSYFDQ